MPGNDYRDYEVERNMSNRITFADTNDYGYVYEKAEHEMDYEDKFGRENRVSSGGTIEFNPSGAKDSKARYYLINDRYDRYFAELSDAIAILRSKLAVILSTERFDEEKDSVPEEQPLSEWEAREVDYLNRIRIARQQIQELTDRVRL